jgi:hypothetical protein
MIILGPQGKRIEKKPDGECGHPDCHRAIDFRKHEMHPPGWGTVAFNRFGQKTDHPTHVTFLLCPRHSIEIVVRQQRLIADPKKKVLAPVLLLHALEPSYAETCMRDSLSRNEAPVQPVPSDEAMLALAIMTPNIVAYMDLELPAAMKNILEKATKVIETRTIQGWGK